MEASFSSYQDLKISFIGLGYVGLPLLLSFSSASSTNGLNWDIVGFDINKERILDLKNNHDFTLEVAESDLSQLPSSTSLVTLRMIFAEPISLS